MHMICFKNILYKGYKLSFLYLGTFNQNRIPPLEIKSLVSIPLPSLNCLIKYASTAY